MRSSAIEKCSQQFVTNTGGAVEGEITLIVGKKRQLVDRNRDIRYLDESGRLLLGRC